VIPHPDQKWGCVSYAQHGDDFMLLNLFQMMGISKPTYLDLGAHHPSVISNTKLLYDRGSSGVNVEANPNLISELRIERPRDKCVQVGVGPAPGQRAFHMYSETSGRNTFSLNEVAATVKRKIMVEVKTLDQIVDQYCGNVYPDLLNCDIEGLDYEVLECARFHRTMPLVVCVETRRDDTKRMVDMMKFKGFFMYCRMGENVFFVRTDQYTRVYY
jgi:FkbM family methyltransferase